MKLTHVAQRSVLLLLLYYIDRICACLQHFTVSSLTVHRFILASVTVASKAFCDAFATNPQFARVGGVSLVELNLLEKEFLAVLDWRLAVSFHFPPWPCDFPHFKCDKGLPFGPVRSTILASRELRLLQDGVTQGPR